MTLSQFVAKWLGGRVDYDGVYGSQCVDLIKQYLHDVYGMNPGAWGNAIDYWTNTNPAILKKFDKVQGTPRAGDIIVYGYPHGVFGGITYGHIAIAVNSTTMLEQNGSTGGGSGTGGDAIRKRSIISNRLGLLRPKESSMATDWNIKRVFRTMLSREPDAGAYTTYRKVPEATLIQSVYESSERANKLKSLGISGYDWVARISSLTRAVSLRDIKIKEQEGKIASLKGTLEGKNEELAGFDDALTNAMSQIADLNAKLTETENELHKCQNRPTDKPPESISEKIVCAINCLLGK